MGIPPPPQNMEEDEGVVQNGGGPHSAARLYHTRADHRGARGKLTCLIPPPPVNNTPISVPPSQIDDSVPTKEEVELALLRLQGHRLGVPS